MTGNSGQPGRHRPADGPVAEAGDTWSASGDVQEWSAPDDQSSRSRTVKIAVGGAALVGIVLAVAIPLQRGSGERPDSAPPAGQVWPPAAASDGTSPGPSGSGQTTASTTSRTTPGRTKTSAPAVATRPAGPGPTTAAATATPTPATIWTALTVPATRVFNLGDSVQTNRTRLVLQPTGDLVITDENDNVRWRSGTAGTGDYAVFQADGNFVVYDGGNGTRWRSNTPGHFGAQLVLKADGDVCIVFNGSVIWSSGTAH